MACGQAASGCLRLSGSAIVSRGSDIFGVARSAARSLAGRGAAGLRAIAGIRVTGFGIAGVREKRGVEDGVPEQHELDRDGVRGTTLRIPPIDECAVGRQPAKAAEISSYSRLASVGVTYSMLDDVPRVSPRAGGHDAVEVRLRRARVSSRSIHTWSRASAASVTPGSSWLLPQLSVSYRRRHGPFPAPAAARLLHEAVLRQGPQVEGTVGRGFAEHLAGLRRGERPGVAERLEQPPAQRVSQRPDGLRVGQVDALASAGTVRVGLGVRARARAGACLRGRRPGQVRIVRRPGRRCRR